MKIQFFLLFTLLLFTSTLFAQPCGPDESMVTIEIQTDVWAIETSWTLSNASSGEIYGNALNTDYENSTLYETTFCVPANQCIEFKISDSYGDGIFDPGYYKVWVDGVEVASNNAFGFEDVVYFNCPPGTNCADAIVIDEGEYVTSNDNAWYAFTADSTGTYKISTCSDANVCDTKIWVYDDCQNLTISEDNTGTIFYNNNSLACGELAELFGYIGAGETFYIRIGDADDNCDGAALTWSVLYDGPVIGCTDVMSCNYNPLATIDDGSCLEFGNADCPEGPDLFLRQDVLESSIYLSSLNATDECLVSEGCLTGLGQRDIIRFTTHIQNIGEQDYFIGEPTNSPDQFTYDNCHGHYHYDGYAEYLLYDAVGTVLPIGFKNGFCVLDLECDNGGTAQYGCSYMGISTGCGDYYSSSLDCQWVDVTDVVDGDYTLVTRVNWDNSPDALGRVEKDSSNNWGQVCVNLDRSTGVLEMTVLDVCPEYLDCAGIPYGDTQPDCMGECGGPVLRGDLNNNNVQEMVDAEMYVSEILANNIEATNCNDLNADQNISVYDAALLSGCLNFGSGHGHTGGGSHDHCAFPDGLLNIFDTVTLSIIGHNFDERYIDIGMMNPTCEVVGYQFKTEGIFVTNVYNLMDADLYPINVNANNSGMVIGLSYEDSTIVKTQQLVPLTRLYFNNIPTTDICLADIIDIVNSDYQQTVTRIVGDCLSFVSGLEEGVMANLKTSVEPNPFDDYTMLWFNNPQGEAFEVTIMDANGKLVRRYEEVREDVVRIEREGLVAGVYWYRLSGAGGVGVGKLMIR